MKKVKGIIISILISFLAIMIMPFSVYADTFNTDSIVGFNVHHRVSSNPQGTQVVYDNDIEVVFDDWYIGGPVTYTIRYKKVGDSSYSTYSAKFGINGTSVTLDTIQTANAYIDPNTVSFTKFVYSDTIYTYSSDVLPSYNFPAESYPMVYYCLAQGFEIGNMYGYGTYTYPMFLSNTSSYISAFQASLNEEIMVILWSDRPINTSNASSYITWNSVYTLQSATMLAYAPGNRTVKLIFKNTNGSSSGERLNLKWVVSDRYWFPVYQWFVQDEYDISTDFGMMYGINNKFLNTFYSLSPNDQSDQAAEDLVTDKTDLDTNMNSLFGIEDNYGDQLNDQLDNIDFTNPLQNNSSMLSSGNFVITVFNGLIANNPLSVLIIIVCIFFVARRLFG